MIRNIITTILCIAVLSGCKNSVRDSLISKVDHECDGKKPGCTIFLRDVTKFKWNKVYIFPDWTTSDSISKAVGFRYDGDDVQDDYSRLLFTYGNKIIHEEDFKSLDYNNSTISFSEGGDSLHRAKVHYLVPSDAIFIVEKDKAKGSCEKCFEYSLMLVKK